jgi:DNA-binding NarL/FixJ family response regulator
MPAVHGHENGRCPGRSGEHSSTAGISVGIIDERPVIGRGISAILDSTTAVRLVDRVPEAAAVEKSCAYDVLVLAIRTSRVIELLRLTDVLAGHCRLVLLASSLELAATLALFDVGHSYLTVDASEQDIRDAVLHAAHGGQYLDRLVADAFRQYTRTAAPQLSPREAELLHHLADGRTHAQAARQMSISVGTADTYIRRIRTKFAITGPVQLARVARQANLLRMLSIDRGSIEDQPTE